MVDCASIFSQLAALFGKAQFHHLVKEHRAERYCKRFGSWDHFARSLRENCWALASTMGKLRHRGWIDRPFHVLPIQPMPVQHSYRCPFLDSIF
jgi:hypothetical protein